MGTPEEQEGLSASIEDLSLVNGHLSFAIQRLEPMKNEQ